VAKFCHAWLEANDPVVIDAQKSANAFPKVYEELFGISTSRDLFAARSDVDTQSKIREMQQDLLQLVSLAHQHVLNHFRNFQILKHYVKRMNLFSQLPFSLEKYRREMLVQRYYSLDSDLLRLLAGTRLKESLQKSEVKSLCTQLTKLCPGHYIFERSVARQLGNLRRLHQFRDDPKKAVSQTGVDSVLRISVIIFISEFPSTPDEDTKTIEKAADAVAEANYASKDGKDLQVSDKLTSRIQT
jgi:hypothetical protein